MNFLSTVESFVSYTFNSHYYVPKEEELVHEQISFIFSFVIAFLLIVSPSVMATDTTEETAEAVEVAEPKKSPIKVGGAMRVNYAYGSYGSEDSPHRRGEKIGDVDLEIFRLNADLDYNNIISRLEYRWYDNYSMIHTAWLGYNFGDFGTVKAGIVRVPLRPNCLRGFYKLVLRPAFLCRTC